MTSSVVTEQPLAAGVIESSVDQGMGFTLPVNLPAPLSRLESCNRIRLSQIFDTLEVVTGCEMRNRYLIVNDSSQQIFRATEESGNCLIRNCFKQMRPFEMIISDCVAEPVMKLTRPLRCQGCCCCCCLQFMNIECPPGQVVAVVKEEWTCCIPRYTIEDVSGNPLYKIDGIYCWIKCCTDVPFQVYNHDRSKQVGTIMKHWGGIRELFGGVNEFSITYSVQLDVLQKAILLTAIFLVDFMYYESK